ncbi:uncharacterized protein BXZ73DRAFT_43304 [Epithele typhae]|uniref:uncharacterized protein n=1 Tax=Epithele typhae TaxID=378194 RepID=UPI0020084B15|nr:uncharacterized protein BXZ73DRAFT_43304 [Epithele typhae]KAH9940120.1 hypothetical protein BXZ73DRAFT_43304 [Epithele typhae]
MPALQLQPYSGSARKLVLGIEVGTTYSGVAYTILDPGVVPLIHGVTRCASTPCSAGDSKIPSILYYNPDGSVACAGAEAALPGMDLEAEDNELVFVEWFKLHLRPERLDAGEIKRRDLPSLPRGKTVVDVFADFLAYLFRCAKRYICETHANGDSLWSSLEDRIEFVLSHPNGWEGAQRGEMRQAAFMAGLVPQTSAGQARVHFITEGEASLHFCIQNGLANKTMQDGQCVMLVDAGRKTVDISSYELISVSPLTIQATSADCIRQGSTHISARVEAHLKEILQDSAFGDNKYIKSMLDYFNKAKKAVFKDEEKPTYIKFGSMGCNDAKVNIRRGQLMLTRENMLSYFQPSLEEIVAKIKKQLQNATRPPTTVFLIGSFAASPWLYASLKRRLEDLGLTLFRPNSHTNKAVANGAVCFFLEHFVSTRVMKITYGVKIVVHYNPADPEHLQRAANTYTKHSGRVVVRDAFSPILKKGTRLRETMEVSQPYHREALDSRTLDNAVADILTYHGPGADPRWTDLTPELFTPLCTVAADTSRVARVARQGPQGVYYEQQFNVVLLCGLTELQAQISWTEDGVERRGPAKVVYDDYLNVSRRECRGYGAHMHIYGSK